jgi:hypothetical protein
MQESRKEFGFRTVSEFLRAAAEFYIEQGNKKTEIDIPDELKKFFVSEEGAMWYAMMFDREVGRRSGWGIERK